MTKSPQRTPSANVTRTWINLMRAQQIALSGIERDLKEAGMPPLAWYDVLWELKRAPDGRLRPFEIEGRTLLAQYNLSRLLDRLERERLVRRVAFEEDGRGQWIAITDSGRALQGRMWTIYAQAIQKHVGAKLSKTAAKTLADKLAKLAGDPSEACKS